MRERFLFASCSDCRLRSAAMRVGDTRLRLTDTEHRARGVRVAKAIDEALAARGKPEGRAAAIKAKRIVEYEGCRGENPFARIPYVNLQDLPCVPVAHAMLYGVVAHFVQDMTRNPSADGDAVEYLLSADQKRLIRSRSKDLTVTADFGRGYKCVLDYRSVGQVNWGG